MSEREDTVPWRNRLSLRLRISVWTAMVVAVVLAVVGLLIVIAVRAQVLELADEAAQIRAEEVAELAAQGVLPRPLPVMESPQTFVEVVSNDQLVTATAGLDASNGFHLPELAAGDVASWEVKTLPLQHAGPFRVAAYGTDTPNGGMTVFAAVPVTDVESTLVTATEVGTIGLVVLVLIMTTILWIAVGRALAPVDAIRARADDISGRNLSSRVPVGPRRDEIGRLARTVNQMLERLERNAVQQRRFVDDAAHELRSPLASLRVQLETARDSAEGGPKETELLQETARMERLVDQMLLLARADADTPWFRASAVDLDDVVDSAVDSSSGESEVTIDTSDVEAVQVMGDADLLEQMVRNLVQNGLRFARELVRVSVGVTEDRTAVVTVEDDGPGIPTDRRQDIFDPFVRLDVSRDREHGGVGLGLAIVSEIVRAHLGTIDVMDSSLGGARFVVELPLEEGMPEDRYPAS